LECKAGSGSPLYLTMQKRYETKVTNLSQNNPSFLQWQKHHFTMQSCRYNHAGTILEKIQFIEC